MGIYDTIKDKLDLVDIAARYTNLEKAGRNGRVKGLCPLHQEHTASFFVFGDTQRWHCFGCNQGGDVFDLIEAIEGVDHSTALHDLARQANVELTPLTDEQRADQERERQKTTILGVAVAHWQHALNIPNNPGREYVYSRAWDDETIDSAGLGYHNSNNALQHALQRANVDLGHNAAKAVLSTPEGSLIYPNFVMGKATYYAARGIKDTRHWNPPSDLLGPRPLYFNHHYLKNSDRVIVVEGQGDAVAIGHLGYPAIAMAGTAVNNDLVETLQRHKQIYIGVENNGAGKQAARALAKELGALCRLVYWPGDKDGYDANDYLKDGADKSRLFALLHDSPTWLDILIDETITCEPIDIEDHLKLVFASLVNIDQFALSRLQSDICKRLDLDKSTFTKLLQIARMEAGLDQNGRPLYEIIGGQTCRRVYDRYGGESISPLAAFSARVVEDVLEDDGQTQVRHFVLDGKLSDGTHLPQTRVKADDFGSMNWVLPAWGTQAMVMAGSGVKDHLRAAIQTLSKEVAVKHEYAHLGWREIEGNLVYLVNNGAVGKSDAIVNVPTDLQRYQLPLEEIEPEQARDAVRASLSFLEIGEYNVTVPLLTAMYLAPLASIFPPAFTVWLYGTTGSMKSTATALAMCHYGTFSYNLPSPATWTSTTAYALRVKSFLAKDVPLWIDDYAKQSTATGERELKKLAETLLREWANRSGRSAGQADGSLRQTHNPRGLVVSTAEQLPPNPSIMPRLYAVEIHPGDIQAGSNSKLTHAQNEHAKLYPVAMASYLRWLAPQMDELKRKLKERRHLLAKQTATELGQHLRSPQNVATMMVAWELFIEHAHAIGAINDEQADGWLSYGHQILISVGEHQDEEVNQLEDPVAMYFKAIDQMLMQGSVYMRHKDNYSDVEYDKPRIANRQNNATFIGWYDTEYYYLIDEVAYNTVVSFYRSGGKMYPDSNQGIKTKLLERQILQPTDSEKYRYRLTMDDGNKWVWRVKNATHTQKV